MASSGTDFDDGPTEAQMLRTRTFTDIFVLKWNQALEQCENDLFDTERSQIRSFQTPDDLMMNLKEKANAAEKTYRAQVFTEIGPTLRIINKVSDILLLAMRPSSIEMTLLWGFLHLTIQLSLSEELKWNQMVKIFTRVGRTLHRCAACSSEFAENDEFKDNLLSIFITLIKFWAAASKFMRNHPLAQTIEYLTNEFEEKMKEIEDATNTMEHCYSSRVAGRGQYVANATDTQSFVTDGTTTGESRVIFPHRHLPPDNVERFIGREDVLEQVDSFLRPNDVQEPRHCCIWGLGGVGKSQTALAYANKYANNFDAMFWVRAATGMSLNKSLRDIALDLALVGRSERNTPEEILDLLHRWFKKCQRNWLIIFDNVDNIDRVQSCVPVSRGAILLTTRYRDVAGGARGSPEAKLQLKAFDLDDAWNMFSGMLKINYRKEWSDPDLVSQGEKEAGISLLKELGCLPLGIRQMAALIRKTTYRTVSKFLDLYTKERGDFRKLTGKGLKFDPDYPHAVETVWNISFNQLKDKKESEGSEAYSVLAVLCFLSPDAIPIELFLEECPVAQFCGDANFSSPLEELTDVALIDMGEENLSIHRLVQTTFLHYLDESSLRRAFETAAYLLNKVFPKQLFGRPLIKQWPECARYIQHAQTVAQVFDKFEVLHSPDGIIEPGIGHFVELLSNCAWYLHEIGDWVDCGDIVRVAKSACQEKNSLIYSHLENTLGCSAFELNDLETCRNSYETSLKIRRQVLDEGDEDLLCTINNYANLENAEGRAEESLGLYAEVQNFRENMGTETRVSLSLTYMGSGQALAQLGRLNEAQKFYDKAYSIVKGEYGPKGHYVSQMYYYYGNLERKRENNAAAHDYYQRGLDIFLETKPNHMLTASLLYKLGVVKAAEGNRDDAIVNLSHAMEISQYLNSEGNIARIARQLVPLLENNEHKPSNKPEDLEYLHTMAELGELRIEQDSTSSHDSGDEHKETTFDCLVCLFFR